MTTIPLNRWVVTGGIFPNFASGLSRRTAWLAMRAGVPDRFVEYLSLATIFESEDEARAAVVQCATHASFGSAVFEYKVKQVCLIVEAQGALRVASKDDEAGTPGADDGQP